MTTKELDEKYFDLRTRERYLKKGVINQPDVDAHLKNLPNDEDNFELVMITEDEIGVGQELTDEEIKAMPAITEENLDNFDFIEESSDKEYNDEEAKTVKIEPPLDGRVEPDDSTQESISTEEFDDK